jgi:hypothetical protein
MIDSRRFASRSHKWLMMQMTLLVIAALILGPPANAESQNDMLVFLSVERFDMFSSADPDLDGADNHATADFLFTHSSDRFRFLGEYIWSDSESELERLQAAWQVDDRTMLWFGRFHSITNYWASEYHHGQFLQTSISRPALDEWEDESGPTPSHITGAWLEHEYSVNGQSSLNLGLAAGLAPKFTDNALVPFDLLDPESGHDLSSSGRLVYRPDILSTNQLGIAVAYNDIVVDPLSTATITDLQNIRQTTLGAFLNWQWVDWRLLSNWVYFDIDLQYGDRVVRDDFVLGYLQGEFSPAQNWTLFGRAEAGFGEDDSPYLQLLPDFIAHRNMVGVRWDFADSQGLTLELADTSTQGDEFGHGSFKELRIQWSGVFP